ncbi:efflux RND transporter periplasmic adaptor subunit [Malaciobacter sp. WC5094]|uniref:efflux RND transporter periplasmic adaptor subunit n=1 Tax=Arcobacter sp. YIC-80 TaxID=3376683 RepID=UPI00384CC3B7
MIKKILVTAFLGMGLLFAKGPSLVETTTLEKGEVNPLQEFVGTLKFDNESMLAAQNSGLVKKVNFEVGDKVSKGKVLVQIDDDLLTAQINAAKANLNIAKNEQKNSSKDYNRYKKLLESKSITQKEYDDSLLKSNSSKSNVKALEAKLKELTIQSQKKRIKAPFSGVVVEKSVNLGEWVSAGSKIAKIVDTSKAEITFNIPLEIVDGLRMGDMYDIKIGKKVVKAKLSSVIPNGDKLTRTFPVKFKANVENIFVFDGQEAKVSLSKDAIKQALVLPRDAVIKRFGQNVVFAVDEKNIAMMIPVKVVGFLSSKVAIEGQGLKEGMQIVVKGNERVFPKSPVKIINKDK